MRLPGSCLPALLVLTLGFSGMAAVPAGAEGQGKATAGSPRLTLAVLPFDTGVEAGDRPGWVYDSFVNRLVATHRFEIVERSRLNRILEELNLGTSTLTDPGEAARLGRIMAADLMLLPSVLKGEGVTRVMARLVDTESAEIFSAYETSELGVSAMILQVLLGRLAERIAADLPVREGVVIRTEADHLYVDLGQDTGIKRHTRLLVLEGSPGMETVMGEAKVLEVYEKFLRAEVVRKNRPPVVMDRVRTK